MTSVDAPDAPGERLEFVALPDGSLLTEEDLPEGALEPLAEAVEEALTPPYRAEAVRHHEGRWAVAARAIDVIQLPDVAGEELVLSVQDGERSFVIDGRREFGSVPELDRLAAERFDSYVIRAEQLDGDLWEFTIAPL